MPQDRESELGREAKRQERNEELRKTFAQHTNSFHSWLTDTRTALMDGRGTLEEQLEAVQVRGGGPLTTPQTHPWASGGGLVSGGVSDRSIDYRGIRNVLVKRDACIHVYSCIVYTLIC